MNPRNPSLPHVLDRIAKSTYVVLFKNKDGKLDLVPALGESKPFSTKNKKFADVVAAEHRGEARTFEEAWNLLIKDDPHFEQRLIERIVQAKPKPIHVPRNHTDPGAGTITDSKGNPLT